MSELPGFGGRLRLRRDLWHRQRRVARAVTPPLPVHRGRGGV